MSQIVPSTGHTTESALPRKIVPLAALAAVGALVLWFDLDRFLTFEALREHRHELIALAEQDGVLAVAAFLLAYAVATALSLPGGAVLTIAGGFLFGPWLGTLYAVIAATIGAVAIFLIAKTALGDSLRRRTGAALKSMEAGFKANAFSYLLTLRLIPLFPFFLVNLVPAFLGVSLRTYTVATLIGIIPGAGVFASAGAGLGSVFDSAETFSPSAVLTPEVIVALSGLGVLSLLPVVYKKLLAIRAQ